VHRSGGAVPGLLLGCLFLREPSLFLSLVTNPCLSFLCRCRLRRGREQASVVVSRMQEALNCSCHATWDTRFPLEPQFLICKRGRFPGRPAVAWWEQMCLPHAGSSVTSCALACLPWVRQSSIGVSAGSL
jgi:hypothetical protein